MQLSDLKDDNPLLNSTLPQAKSWVNALAPYATGTGIVANGMTQSIVPLSTAPLPTFDDQNFLTQGGETLESLGAKDDTPLQLGIVSSLDGNIHNVAQLTKKYLDFSDAPTGLRAVLNDFGVKDPDVAVLLARIPGATAAVDAYLGVTR